MVWDLKVRVWHEKIVTLANSVLVFVSVDKRIGAFVRHRVPFSDIRKLVDSENPKRCRSERELVSILPFVEFML